MLTSHDTVKIAIIVTSLTFFLDVIAQGKQDSAQRPGGNNAARSRQLTDVRALRDVGGQRVSQTNQPATLSLTQLHDGQQAWRTALLSYRVKFIYKFERYIETPSDTMLKQQGRLPATDNSFRVDYASKGEKRYNAYDDLTPENTTSEGSTPPVGPKNKKAAKKPRTQTIVAFTGKAAKSYEPYRSIGQILPNKPSSVDNLASWYSDAMNIFVGPNAEQLKSTAFYLPTALEQVSDYLVLPTLEEVDGKLCHVVSSDHDTFWIDAQCGFAMRRRVWSRLGREDEPAVLDNVLSCQDLKEFPGGIWLPFSCNRIDFGCQNDPIEIRGKAKMHHIIKAEEIHVNDVPDELFEIDFPPGTDVIDLVKNVNYLVPKGSEQLDKAIENAKPIVNGVVLRRPTGSEYIRPIGLAASVCILLILLLRIIWTRRKL